MTSVRTTVVYEPSFQDTIAAQSVSVQGEAYVEVEVGLQANKVLALGALPPVVKYISPAIAETNGYVLIEQKPQPISDIVISPWNYFLVRLRDGGATASWFMRPDKLDSPKEEIHQAWVDDVEFKDFDSYIDETHIVTIKQLPKYDLSLVVKQCWEVIQDLDAATIAKTFKALTVDVLKDENRKEEIVRSVGKALFTIDDLHTYACEQAANSIPTLSELLMKKAGGTL